MQALNRPWGAMHYRIDGPEAAPAVLFANSLGTDLRLWDKVMPWLAGFRVIRFDKRGHGLSDRSPAHSIADLADDAAALLEAVAPGGAVVVGLSIGGAIAQSLAHRRPDLVRAIVLSNTAAKLGAPDAWEARIAALEAGGMPAIIDAVMTRWFGPAFLAGDELPIWRNMVLRADVTGYIETCRVLAGFDLSADTARLSLPTLVIAGEKDGASPPALVQGTAELIEGAAFHTLPEAGHLPCVEVPVEWADLVLPFLTAHARPFSSR